MPRLMLAAVLLAVLPLSPTPAQDADPSVVGRFSQPFEEPGEKCVEQEDGTYVCKPTAGTMAILPNGEVFYFNALEATENIQNGIAVEFGSVAVNDQSRVMNLTGPSWRPPTPVDGGAANTGGEYIVPDPLVNDPESNDGAMFCSDIEFLADGRVLIVGGTDYYAEPAVPGTEAGVVELEGLKSARIYDPATATYTQTGDMAYGRWYPSLVTLPDGDLFVASGVTKLMKPVYPDRPDDSGRNVVQTETYDVQTGTWSYNGETADKSLPLYPRLRLLPNGHIYYDAAGQTFNPNGQAYDEPLWNIASSYDPVAKAWTDLGIPGQDSNTPGFRGSTFSVSLPLKPPYTQMEILSAGGVLGTTPGAYIATDSSTLHTVDVSSGAPTLLSVPTGNLNNPRWFPTAVPLPDGTVLAFSGADKDEVIAPGTGVPDQDVELFDPATGEWTTMARQGKPRTYHNTAALLPDGRVLVGGHAPISTLYGSNTTLPGFSPNDGRDPSFEIYEPPYLFRGPRPSVTGISTSQVGYGGGLVISTPDAARIASVVLARNTSITHVIDGDQRTVELEIVARTADTVTVRTPPNGNVAPPGPYMLFVMGETPQGLTPSVSQQVTVADVLMQPITLPAPQVTAPAQPPPAATPPPAPPAPPPTPTAPPPAVGSGGVLPATGGGALPLAVATAALGAAAAGARRRRR